LVFGFGPGVVSEVKQFGHRRGRCFDA
jgi:hypothetical protein